MNSHAQAEGPAKIRPVTRADVAELVELCAEHAAFERASYSREGREQGLEELLFREPPRLYGWVIETSNGLAGYATVALEASTFDAALYLHMDCLFLRPEARNAGLGRRLMQAIARQALDLGVGVVQWQTPDFNVDAARFYRRAGASEKNKVRFFLEGAALRALAEG